jgi:hypothetical protein
LTPLRAMLRARCNAGAASLVGMKAFIQDCDHGGALLCATWDLWAAGAMHGLLSTHTRVLLKHRCARLNLDFWRAGVAGPYRPCQHRVEVSSAAHVELLTSAALGLRLETSPARAAQIVAPRCAVNETAVFGGVHRCAHSSRESRCAQQQGGEQGAQQARRGGSE